MRKFWWTTIIFLLVIGAILLGFRLESAWIVNSVALVMLLMSAGATLIWEARHGQN